MHKLDHSNTQLHKPNYYVQIICISWDLCINRKSLRRRDGEEKNVHSAGGVGGRGNGDNEGLPILLTPPILIERDL